MSYYLERIQRGVDYVEARLDEDVALSAVARAGGLSQWHFQRIFKSLTGETLKSYIRARRLAKALERLLDTDLRVLDIAVLAGFESQEAFARAFKKAFERTPQEYRRLGAPRVVLKKPVFDADYLRHVHQSMSLDPVIERRPRMLLVGVQTHFHGVDSEMNDFGEKLPPLWQAFLPRLESIPHRVDGGSYGVIRQEREDGDRLEYHAAVEVTAAGPLPEGMVSLAIAAASYARFTHRGPVKSFDHTVSYAYSTWLATSRRRHTGGPDLEIYRRGEYHPTSDDSVVHYAIPVGDAEPRP
ncbi:MAG TPA: helix-turn-helix domain-containing protein [Polyangiaceae bacterium]|nr:helix-turn-helix domain-containing protein [Polyangiaceae bacterium]